MKQDIENIDYEYLTSFTGDPFADLGGNVISFLSDKFPEKNIVELIEYVSRVYIENWGCAINSFFLNHPITQPSFKGRELSETMKYYNSIINDIGGKNGMCRITGRNTKIFKYGRHNTILTGSSTFSNFYPTFSDVGLSKEIIIRMLFVPFGVIKVRKYYTVIHSNLTEINNFFAKLNCEENINNLSNNNSPGALDSVKWSIGSYVFNFIDKVLQNKIDNDRSASIAIYHFTNYSTKAASEGYIVQPQVFDFYRKVHSAELKKDWEKFVDFYYKHHNYKNAKYDEQRDVYIDGEEVIYRDEFKTWRNVIHEKLLHNSSILPLLEDHAITHAFNMDIIKYYVTLCRG